MPVSELVAIFQIYYELVGEGVPLVYLAGTRFDSAKDKAAHLRQHAGGFRSIIPDLRGMGGSTHTSEAEPEDWVNDLAALLTQLNLPRCIWPPRRSVRASRSASPPTTRSTCEP